MKSLNIALLSTALALVVSLGAAMVAEQLFPKEIAMPISFTIALLFGLNSRRLTEKILGYTLSEALSEGNKKDEKEQG